MSGDGDRGLVVNAIGDMTCVIEFRQQLGQWRDMVIAFDHGRNAPEAAHGLGIQLPHRIDDRFVMGIDDVITEITMTGEMKLLHPLPRYGCEISARVESVIKAADVDVVDVEQ